MRRTRYTMKLDLTPLAESPRFAAQRVPLMPAAANWRLRAVTGHDLPALAALLIAAYQGTIDDEGESPAEAVCEMTRLFEGKYGELLNDASFVVEVAGDIVAASLITCWQQVPLVAHVYTHPAYQQRGLAYCLLHESIRALTAAGYPALVLYVTVGNDIALRLYADLGFVTVETYEEDFSPGA